MTSHDIADMIFSVKEKLTDKEFKDIMEKLSIKKKEEEEENIYVLKYVKTKYKMDSIDTSVGFRFTPKIKTKKVKLSANSMWANIDNYMKYIDDGWACGCYHFNILEKKNKYPLLDISNGQPDDYIMLKPPGLKWLDPNEGPEIDVIITYHDIVPISLKLST